MRIHAVVVTFNIGSEFADNLATYSNQVEKVWVVDNGSAADRKAQIQAAVEQASGAVSGVYLPGNQGIAAAQNTGIRKAMEEGADWVVLFDHDSQASPGMVAKMLALTTETDIGIVAPIIHDINASRPLTYLVRRPLIFFSRKPAADLTPQDVVLAVIASGSLLRVSMLEKIGLMKEEFFIDYVDSEFSVRALRSGYVTRIASDAVLLHELGKRRLHKTFGLTHSPTNHSPIRKYYMTRNRLWVWRHYFRYVPSYVAYDILAFGYDLTRILFFEKSKAEKYRRIVRGIRDSLAGQFGPLRG